MKIRNIVSTLILSTILLIGSSQPAKAGLGLATLGGVPLILGGVLAGAGVVGVIGSGERSGRLETILISLGLIILNEETNTVEMTSLSEQAAREIGVSEVERESYNRELNRVNGILEEVTVELPSLSNSEVISRVQGELSAETFSALTKIFAATLK